MLETNEYFEGKVKSIGFQTNTLPATVGVMEVGEYEFDTSKKETVTGTHIMKANTLLLPQIKNSN